MFGLLAIEKSKTPYLTCDQDFFFAQGEGVNFPHPPPPKKKKKNKGIVMGSFFFPGKSVENLGKRGMAI